MNAKEFKFLGCVINKGTDTIKSINIYDVKMVRMIVFEMNFNIKNRFLNRHNCNMNEKRNKNSYNKKLIFDSDLREVFNLSLGRKTT